MRKKSRGLREILHESVWETAQERLQQNERFVRKADGETQYVALLLDTNSVGGFDKKARKDESKGSILEQISSGRIFTYMTGDMLEKGIICIVPDETTVHAMQEYTLLAELASYELCGIDSHGAIRPLGVNVTWRQISDLFANKDSSVSSLLGDSDEEEPESFVDISSSSTKESDAKTDSDSDSDGEDDDDEIISMVDSSGNVLSVTPSETSSDSPGSDAVSVPEAPPDEPEKEQTIPSDVSSDTIIRTFYDGDLRLEVSSAQLDTILNHECVLFDVDRPDSEFNRQLNEKCRAANMELSRLHADNQQAARNMYFKLMTSVCDKIQRDLDFYDPNTPYGKLYAEAEQARDRALSAIGPRVQARRDALEQAWNNRLKSVGIEAARAEQAKYRERYQMSHDLQMQNVESSERAAISANFADEKHELGERRREEASVLLESGINETLAFISDEYALNLESERARYRALEEEIRVFVDAIWKDEIARAKVLEEEQRRSDKADRVLAEQTSKMQALSEEYRRKREDLLLELQTVKNDNAAKIAALKAEHEREESRWKSDKESMDRRYDALLEKYQEISLDFDMEADTRLQEAKETNDLLEDRCHRLTATNQRSYMVYIFLLTAGVIAALIVGIVVGLSLSDALPGEMPSVSSQIVSSAASSSDGILFD